MGLSASPLKLDSYCELIAPDEARERKTEMAKMSGCGLVVRGIWKMLGLSHPLLDRPYVTGRAVSDIVEIARSVGAWCPGKVLPGQGDAFCIENPEHVAICDSLTDTGGIRTIYSVDGGQRDPRGYQCILRRSRSVVASRPPFARYAIVLSSDNLEHRPLLGTINCVVLYRALGTR